MKIFVYLAGPVTGHTVSNVNDWRYELKSKFPKNIVGVSPLREQEAENPVYKIWTDEPKFGSPMAISGKNWYDTLKCDVVLAYLPKQMNDQHPSYGTVIEIGWAIGVRKPIILVTDDPNLSEHPLIKTNVNWIFDNFDDAVHTITGIFGTYTE